MSLEPTTTASILSLDEPVVLDVLGPTIEILTEAATDARAPMLLRGTIPPGGTVPMHAHADPETFFVLSGALEGLVRGPGAAWRWVPVEGGHAFHVPPGAPHALRNPTDQPNVALIITTPQMAEFFAAIGQPIATPEAPRSMPDSRRLKRFAELSQKRGYWNATLEENAAVGIELPAPAS